MIRDLTGRLRGMLPELRLPEFGREVEIPVFLIHISPDAEDYFFLIDFEQFAEKSTEGLFVRPKLKLWAGRDDFSRATFAAHFREVFQAEFDRMRAELASGKQKRGWLTWGDALGIVPNLVGGLLANLLLMIAASTGKALFGQLVPTWMKGKSDAAKLEARIDDLRSAAEKALAKVDVALHRELYDHAFRDGPRGPVSGIDRDAWPLPAHVRVHLDDGRSGSWW